ncbi:hypothetical protein CGZ93_16615 [Enemella dayhoffiae]|uniref:Uncharacterized protein n=2 Tax=Enemella dayhoffiae TaxID=2016507 RepID=A0A255GMZ4_9ACTN|nr:hypothetical protein CGZ93_16615 [Enemella dayhoffiae]
MSLDCTVSLKGAGAEAKLEHKRFDAPRTRGSRPTPDKNDKKNQDRMRLQSAEEGGIARMSAIGRTRSYSFECTQGQVQEVAGVTVTCTKVAKNEVELLLQ